MLKKIVSRTAAFTLLCLFVSTGFSQVKRQWGGKITLSKEIPLAEAVLNYNESSEKNDILVTGKVDKVCIKKGCWMVIKDGKLETRVTFKDYGFFVDESLIGKKILAQGKLVRKTISKAEVAHYLVDEGMSKDEANKKAKEKTTFSFVASAVKL